MILLRKILYADDPSVSRTHKVKGHMQLTTTQATDPKYRGAVNNGCTELEIQETMLQTSIYCGIPCGVSMFRVADRVIKQLKEEGLLKA